MKVTINVTQEDIEEGQRGDCRSCPIALAINKCLKNMYFCEIDGSVFADIYRVSNNRFVPQRMETYIINLKDYIKQVKSFIKDFDESTPVSPFTFTVDIPDELLKDEFGSQI